MCILNSFCNIEVEEKGFIDTFEVDEMKKLSIIWSLVSLILKLNSLVVNIMYVKIFFGV